MADADAASTLLTQSLQALLRQDPRLLAVSQAAGPVMPRTRPAGFPGLARIICWQQVSVASAEAIWGRLAARKGGDSARDFLSLHAAQGLEGVGLSRNKQAAIHAIALALEAGQLDLDAIARLPAQQAIDTLTCHKGIGPWTAEIYLMFCANHPDIFPAGDLALRKAVGQAFGIEPAPPRDRLAELALEWAPHRSAAALLFWRYYAATRQRDVLPV